MTVGGESRRILIPPTAGCHRRLSLACKLQFAAVWAQPANESLLVEDNADVRRLYAIGLNQRGSKEAAANVAEAVDRVATDVRLHPPTG